MSEGVRQRAEKATLAIDGKRIPLNRFVEGALVGVVEGFVSAMRDIPAGELVLTIPADRRRAAAPEPPLE
jgi:hypothetical protein